MVFAQVVLVLLVFLAVFRLTVLLVVDEFPPVAALRERVFHRWGEPDQSWQGYLVTCPWCMSVWVSAPLTAAVDQWTRPGLPAPFLVFLAASAVTGLLSSTLDDD